MIKLSELLILTSVVVTVAGCSSDSKSAATSVAPGVVNISDQADLFEYFDGSRYLSETLGDAGMGEDGPVMARLPIDFGNGTLDWSVSGLVQSGSYEFLDSGSMIVTLESAVFEVPIDTAENTIVWMGETYTREQ